MSSLHEPSWTVAPTNKEDQELWISVTDSETSNSYDTGNDDGLSHNAPEEVAVVSADEQPEGDDPERPRRKSSLRSSILRGEGGRSSQKWNKRLSIDFEDFGPKKRLSIDIEDLEQGWEDEADGHAPERQRRKSSLRSSLLRGEGDQSQKSLRWSKRLSIDFECLLDEDLSLEGPKSEGEPHLESDIKDRSSEGEPPVTRRSSITSSVTTTATEAGSSAIKKKTIKTVVTQNSQVFFMIGCQRSGSNWLRTMLSEREDLIAPHPPHIMRDFMPRLERYGDLAEQENLKVLIDHVCAFVERNQVQWLDLHSRPMKFKRSAILMDVMITIQCFLFKEKYTAMQEGKEVVEKVDNPYYLLATFDAIMNTMTKANGKKIWMCKSMGMSQFHELLLSFYGKERLRYIYLVRDPRDVCLSFMKTPVGDCHPYAIAKKWAKLQNFAFHILQATPDLIHQVCYEEVLGNKEAQVAKIVEFMGSRDVCRSMRRGSIIAIKSEKDVVAGAKKGREAKMARRLSYQFQNLNRGDSFSAGQFKKWIKEMKDDDLLLVESVAFEEMGRLGYEPHLVQTTEDRTVFSEETCEEYTAENKKLIEKMNADLAIDNPGDLERRKVQAAVLEKTISEHYDEEFVKKFLIDVDCALDSMDDVQNDKGFQRQSSARFDFHKWPLNASCVGFQAGDEVSERFEMQEKQTMKLKGGLSITFAAASQAGYYPNERDKANQDTYIAGERVYEPRRNSLLKKEKNQSGVLFAVFDGHGPSGAECARRAQEFVKGKFVNEMKIDKKTSIDESINVTSHFSSSYHQASAMLESGEKGVDASHSGTTATSLFITKDFLHTANVGDSRCLLIVHNQHGKTSVKALTEDHTPNRVSEIKRIEAHGGVVMSSEQYDSNDPTQRGSFTSFQQKRIWSKAGKWPGTAFTRSIGDAVAKKLGVCADPECANFSVPTSDAMFVLGSDGVFDFIPDEEIGAIVKKYDDPEDACRELVGKAWNRWSDSEERTDDITVIVGHVKHSTRGVLGKLRRRFLRSS